MAIIGNIRDDLLAARLAVQLEYRGGMSQHSLNEWGGGLCSFVSCTAADNEDSLRAEILAAGELL